MANIRKVNKAIKQEFPNLDIEAVRGDGYFYFDGEDGLDKVESIMAHPPSISTEDMIRIAVDAIRDVYER